MPKTLYIGNILHCIPEDSKNLFNLQIKGLLLVEDTKIIEIGEHVQLDVFKSKYNPQETVTLSKTQILIPGLVDAHIHAPQYPNVGLGYDKELLDWLDNYTYKLEAQYSDQSFANKVFNAVVKKTLSHGTTTACYFASMYDNSSLLLADAAIKHQQRAFIGKINMEQFAPANYIELFEESLTKTIKFIQDVRLRNSSLVQPIITPRFAISCGMKLMTSLAELAQKEDVHIQSHISENQEEIKLVKKLYSDCTSYAKVYDQAKLLTPKTVLAHGVHLTPEEMQLLAERGTSIAHCPASNTCLRSGLCNVRQLHAAGVTVGLGTDVSGGPSPSIVEAMRQAIDTSIHISYQDSSSQPLTYIDAFYLATLGGAKALALHKVIGNFEAGKDFDALLVDIDVANSSADCLCDYTPLELLQKFVYLGDDRNILKVFVAGRNVKV